LFNEMSMDISYRTANQLHQCKRSFSGLL